MAGWQIPIDVLVNYLTLPWLNSPCLFMVYKSTIIRPSIPFRYVTNHQPPGKWWYHLRCRPRGLVRPSMNGAWAPFLGKWRTLCVTLFQVVLYPRDPQGVLTVTMWKIHENPWFIWLDQWSTKMLGFPHRYGSRSLPEAFHNSACRLHHTVIPLCIPLPRCFQACHFGFWPLGCPMMSNASSIPLMVLMLWRYMTRSIYSIDFWGTANELIQDNRNSHRWG